MKLSSLSAVLLLSALAAAAEVVMVSGTVYDVGKGYCSTDSTVTNKTDSDMCWAAAASNLIQHWQDAYGVETTGAPDGTQTGYTMPSGTLYLKVFDLFRNNFVNDGGDFGMAVNWYFNGDNTSGKLKEDHADKAGYHAGQGISYGLVDVNCLDTLKSALDTPFQKNGYAAFLSIAPAAGGTAHAITCWGYETDENREICALYITDSDDMKFGAQRLDVTMNGNEILLSSSYTNSYYSSSVYKLSQVSYITSETLYNNTKSSNALESLPGAIGTAADISGQRLSSDSRLTLEAGGLLAASGKGGTSLTLDGGGYTNGVGLLAQAGSMVSLSQADVTVSGFRGPGMSILSEAHINKGSVTVSGNGGVGLIVKGAEEDPKAYMGLSGNSSVLVSNNEKGGLLVGAGILPLSSGGYHPAGDQLDITDNARVVIRDNNTQGNGGGALVNGALNLAGNTKLEISGNTAEIGAAIYANTTAVPTSDGLCAVTFASVAIDRNGEVTITGNTAKSADIVYFRGDRMSVSGNTEVTLSGNRLESVSNTSAVLHNSADPVKISSAATVQGIAASIMEIAHNGSVTFANNQTKYDIYNEGDLYLCADGGQRITFQHGFSNSKDGTTTIGKDAAGTTSDAKGAYVFTDGAHSATLETTVATVKTEGGMVFAEALLTVSGTEFGDPVKFTLDGSSLKLSDITFSDPAATMAVDFGYFGDKNKLTWENHPDTVKLAMHLDLVKSTSSVPLLASAIDTTAGMGTTVYSGALYSSVDALKINLSDYFGSPDSSYIELLSLTVDGWEEGQALAINTSGFNLSNDFLVNGKSPTDSDTANGTVIYYYTKAGEETPEPATGTLSLLAMAALAARRKRRRTCNK